MIDNYFHLDNVVLLRIRRLCTLRHQYTSPHIPRNCSDRCRYPCTRIFHSFHRFCGDVSHCHHHRFHPCMIRYWIHIAPACKRLCSFRFGCNPSGNSRSVLHHFENRRTSLHMHPGCSYRFSCMPPHRNIHRDCISSRNSRNGLYRS